MIQFGVLGPVEAWVDGRPVELARGRQRAVLAMLLLDANRSVSAEALIDGLWEVPPRTARTALHGVVAGLRQALNAAGVVDGSDVLAWTPSGYRLRVGEVDLAMFERLWGEARQARAANRLDEASGLLDQALSLWRGPPLADVASMPFARLPVAQLEEMRTEALEDRFEVELLRGRHLEVLRELAAMVKLNPLRERLRGQLMLALYRSGRQAEALEVYREGRQVLVGELGLEPAVELRRLHQAILDQSADLDLDGRPVPMGPLVQFKAVSEAPPSQALIGRARELDELTELLADPEVRLLTMTGIGGIGKTRLALAALERMTAVFADGAATVLLAGISDPELVASAVCQALEIREGERSPQEALQEHLSRRRMLLLLDNFEQVLPAAPLVSKLLDSAPGLKVLITSRALIGAQAEREFSVPPLSLPPPGATGAAADSDAVALFIDRACRADPQLAIGDEELSTIVAICRRLDALPLALELAAARLRVLSIAQLHDRLAETLPLLTTGRRDAPKRHRTLRATLEWSYELLERSPRRTFARLGAFVGGFTLEAALAVCTTNRQPEVELLDDLATLRDHNLILRHDWFGEPRFLMLEVVREYAAELLRSRRSHTIACQQHAAFYATLTEQAEMGMLGDEQPRWLNRLDAEIDNLRAAMRWSLASNNPDLVLQIMGCSRRFWWVRGRMREASGWLSQGLASARPTLTRARVKALSAAAQTASQLGDRSGARRYSDEALEQARQLGDHHLLSSAATNRAIAAHIDEDYELAGALHRESLAAAAKTGEPGLEGLATLHLSAFELERGNSAQAAELAQEAAELLEPLGASEALAIVLTTGAYALALERRYADAAKALREGAAIGITLNARGSLAFQCVCVGAIILTAMGRYRRAARLLGLVTVVQSASGLMLDQVDAAAYERAMASTKAALGEPEFAVAYRAGADLPADVALAEVMQAFDFS